MGWKMGAGFRREGTCVYLWLIDVYMWQKSTQYYKAIILQLKQRERNTSDGLPNFTFNPKEEQETKVVTKSMKPVVLCCVVLYCCVEKTYLPQISMVFLDAQETRDQRQGYEPVERFGTIILHKAGKFRGLYLLKID